MSNSNDGGFDFMFGDEPEIPQTPSDNQERNVGYQSIINEFNNIPDELNGPVTFGHGPVIHDKQIQLTQDQFNHLKPEEQLLYYQGWSFEWEDVIIGDDASNTSRIKYKIKPRPQIEYEEYMWDVIDEFENRAWSSKNVGLKTGFPSIDHAFDKGIKPGFIVIGGDSNLGKSGFMSQMAIQIAKNNDNAYVMDFSLDDPMQDKLPRVVGSSNKILLNAVRNPNNFSGMQLMLARRKQGLLELRNMTNKYRAYDANFSVFVEDIAEEIIRVKTTIVAAGEEKQLVVFIDNMHDLDVRDTKFNGNTVAKYDFIAQWCADIAIKLDIVLVCSAELKKLNGARRPGLDDIREAVKIKYEAKAILMVYNEVHYKAEGSAVYFMRNDKQTKQPVFEVHFAKNKFSSYKGRLFFEFYPEMARFEEPDENTKKTYSTIVFGI